MFSVYRHYYSWVWLGCCYCWIICEYHPGMSCPEEIVFWKKKWQTFFVEYRRWKSSLFVWRICRPTLSRVHTLPSTEKYCFIYNSIKLISLYNDLTSMAALCYIMYQNIIKFPGNRLLDFLVSIKIIVANWCLSLVLVPSAHFGLLIMSIEGDSVCEMHRKKKFTTAESISIASLIILTTIWISVCSTIIGIFLRKIYYKLKQHRVQSEQVLHQASRTKVISFHKQAQAMISCYFIFWLPHGVLAALMNTDLISCYFCVYFAGLVCANATAVSTPVVYLTIDKRFRVKCSWGNRAVVGSHAEAWRPERGGRCDAPR